MIDNGELNPRLKLIAISFGLLNVFGEKNSTEIMGALAQYQETVDPSLLPLQTPARVPPPR